MYSFFVVYQSVMIHVRCFRYHLNFGNVMKIMHYELLYFCRGLPCGVQPPEPVPDPDGDKLATIAARFSYFQERKNASSTSSTAVVTKVDLRRSINPPARYKNARPTVRLRPRQVLCSKCRSICNENSENVDVSRKRKHEEAQQQSQQVLWMLPEITYIYIM